jgi:hypothetical protein
MILRTVDLSSSQRTAFEKLAGRERQATVAERQSAAELMRHQLYLLDRSQRRMSIEDFAAALLEDASGDLPA